MANDVHEEVLQKQKANLKQIKSKAQSRHRAHI